MRNLNGDVHPFKLIRHSLEPRMTIKQLAYEAMVEPLIVIRTEQGLFSEPPEGILLSLSVASFVSQTDLVTQYKDWQRRQRWINGKALIKVPAPVGLGVSAPIYEYLRHAWPDLGLQGRAKKLCVHHSTLMRYEQGLQPFMPGQLAIALSHAGVDSLTLELLDRLGQQWYAKWSAV